MIPKNRISKYMDDNMQNDISSQRPDIATQNKLLHEFAETPKAVQPPPYAYEEREKTAYFRGYQDGYNTASTVNEAYLKEEVIYRCIHIFIGLIVGIALSLAVGAWL
jgi:hypothetical protein